MVRMKVSTSAPLHRRSASRGANYPSCSVFVGASSRDCVHCPPLLAEVFHRGATTTVFCAILRTQHFRTSRRETSAPASNVTPTRLFSRIPFPGNCLAVVSRAIVPGNVRDGLGKRQGAVGSGQRAAPRTAANACPSRIVTVTSVDGYQASQPRIKATLESSGHLFSC